MSQAVKWRCYRVQRSGTGMKRGPWLGDHAEGAGTGLIGFQLFFRVERQLDHALKELIGRQSCKILEHEFLHVQPHEVAQLQRPVPCRKDEIPVSAVDHDNVALGVKAAAPELAARSKV